MIAAAMGWIGTVGTIGAYVLLVRGRLSAGSVRYGALNGLGGLLAAAASATYGAWPSVGSNLIWSAVAAHSIIATLRERHVARTLAVVPDPEPEPTGTTRDDDTVDWDPPTGPQPVLAAA
jgi:hypothetical protein